MNTEFLLMLIGVEMNNSSSFLNMFLGYFEKNELIIWILIQFSWTAIFMFIAYLFHRKQNPYSIMTHSISFLGSWIPERNPKGWWNLSIALIGQSIMFIPLNLYYYRNMAKISSWAALVGVILLFIGSFGVFLVGIVPDNEGYNFFKDLKYGQVHNVVAALGFGGYIFGNLWYGIMFIYDAIWGAKIYNLARFLPPYIILLVMVLIIAYTQWKWEQICQKDKSKEPFPGEGIYSFPLWEWIITFYLFISMYYVLLSF
ncbi:MAG: DUF998 domain-containing protein [Promethearchaeota archaeon]